MAFYVYIVASRRNGTLYVGSTDDLPRRVHEHRAKVRPDSFAARHDADRLVWYEWHETRETAFRRERQIKTWNRLWKLRMIEEMNPGWHDLLDRLSL
jgi:putative endonuclease